MATEKWRDAARVKLETLSFSASSDIAMRGSVYDSRNKADRERKDILARIEELKHLNARYEGRYAGELSAKQDELQSVRGVIASIDKRIDENNAHQGVNATLFHSCESVMQAVKGV